MGRSINRVPFALDSTYNNNIPVSSGGGVHNICITCSSVEHTSRGKGGCLLRYV